MAHAHLSQQFGQPFQFNHAATLEANQRVERREPLTPRPFREAFTEACRRANAADVEIAGTREFLGHALAGLRAYFHHDKTHFARRYREFQDMRAPHALLLPGQTATLDYDMFQPVDNQLNQALQQHAALATQAWDRVCFGSVQGLVPLRDGTMMVQCTQVAVARTTEDQDMFVTSLAHVAADVAARATFLAACAMLYSDIHNGAAGSFTQLCDQLLQILDETAEENDPAAAADSLRGPCSEANAYRLNWLPFTQAEADFVAFGLKVAADALPAVVLSIQRMGQPGYGMDLTGDRRLTLTLT